MKYEVIAPDDNKPEIINEKDKSTYIKKGYKVIRPIPETVEDEDFIAGWAYPGHECWPDPPPTIEDYKNTD